jgi:hypothetical protein
LHIRINEPHKYHMRFVSFFTTFFIWISLW